MPWTPRLAADLDPGAVELEPEPRHLLDWIDGSAGVADLARATGLPEGRVAELLGRLVELGVVAPEADAVPSGGDLFAPMELPGPAPSGPPPPAHRPREEGEAPAEGANPAPDLPPADLPPEGAEAASAEEEGATGVAAEANARQLFETRLHPLPADLRASMARLAEEPELSALCFDPVPAVVAALLENDRFGPVHARLVAAHHRNPVGLEALGRRSELASDPGVKRALLRNPQLPGSLFRRLFASRRLLELYQLSVSREAPERTRQGAREALRTGFLSRASDEKVEMIMKTEGRCLASLVGLAPDQRTTAILCSRSFLSSLFVQNIARWSAAPPNLIAHLRRQEIVRRNPSLRMMLERHPNASGSSPA